MLSKAFWQDFREGCVKASIIGVPAAVAFLIGFALGSYDHPYEKCKRMYESFEDISECVWILEHDR